MTLDSGYSAVGRPSDDNFRPSSACSLSRLSLVALCVGAVAVGIGLGFLLGYFVNPSQRPSSNNGTLPSGFPKKLLEEADPRISSMLLEEINPANIQAFLRNLTSHPHLGGTPADKATAELIASFWRKWGFDNVQIVEHEVLLSYPNHKDPSNIELKANNGSLIYRTQLNEKVLTPQENQTDAVPPFNAYSAPCDIETGHLIYVNYGTEDDFLFLKQNKSMNFHGAIVISRYGKIFRSNKVELAAQYGALGIILYTDPADYAVPGVSEDYPATWWLPGTGVQRGTVKLDSGDPLTPSYPATKSAYRIPENETTLPKICSHPIGYDDARVLLKQLGGDIAPTSWRGGIADVDYRIGPSLSNMSISMHITTANQINSTYTPVGIITGSVEPDRYVLVGNHHDAWVFGALDPSSGTAGMLELARAFTRVMQTGNWRPRRSVVFCAWGSEEYGLVGSIEFVQQFGSALMQRAVAYINVDILLEGMDFMRVLTTPLLQNAIYSAAQKVRNPNATEAAAGRTSVYDSWLYYQPASTDPSRPKVSVPGSGSDFASFVQLIGVECVDLRYTFSQNFTNIPAGSYPLYHTLYETFHLVNDIMDPSFLYSRAVTQVWAELARDLSDSLILPFDVSNLAAFIESNADNFISTYGVQFSQHNLSANVDYLQKATLTFTDASAVLAARIATANRMNPAETRFLNDQLMNVQRSFIDPNGLPGRPQIKNVVYAPSQFNSYSGAVFSGVVDALYRIDEDADQVGRWNRVHQQLSVLTYVLESAASTLQNASDFAGTAE